MKGFMCKRPDLEKLYSSKLKETEKVDPFTDYSQTETLAALQYVDRLLNEIEGHLDDVRAGTYIFVSSECASQEGRVRLTVS